MLKACLDLMQQNRYVESDKLYGSDNSLLLNRWTVWDTLEPKIKQLPNERLLSKYLNMTQKETYPEFVSLVVYLFAIEFRRRNLVVPE